MKLTNTLFLTPDPAEGNNPPSPAPKTSFTREELDAEVIARVERARTEEKDKLYPQIKSLGDKLALSEKQAADAKAEAEKAKSEAEAIAKAAKLPDGTIDTKALIAEVTEKATKRAETAMQAQIDELRTKSEASERIVKGFELKTLRDRLIAEAGGADSLILSMVSGNSEAELRASIETAKSTATEMEARVLQRHGITGDTATAAHMPPPITTPGVNGGTGSAPANGRNVRLETVREMSVQEFTKSREATLAEVAKRYPAARR